MKMILIWIQFVVTLHAYQISDPNCMRANPGLLDAHFNVVNKYIERPVCDVDIAKQISLFSSRFKRAHILPKILLHSGHHIKIIGLGLSIYTNSSNKNKVRLFLDTIHPRRTTMKEVINAYKETYQAVVKINSGNEGPVVGLYLSEVLDNYIDELTALEFVFGKKGNSTFPVGSKFVDCFGGVEAFDGARSYLKRLDFITCEIQVEAKLSPENSADDVLRRCDGLEINAKAMNLTAEIICSIGYPSYGTISSGVTASVLSFQRFWCRIVNELKRNASHTSILMESAFNLAPTFYPWDKYIDLTEAKYHTGWWRRRHAASYEESAFAEKVEELKGGREYGRCSRECAPCQFSHECCEGIFCYVDSSFQPFESKESQSVCQSVATVCAPRFPVTTSIDTFSNSALSNYAFKLHYVLIMAIFQFMCRSYNNTPAGIA